MHADWQGPGRAGTLLFVWQETEKLSHMTSMTHDILTQAQPPLQRVTTTFLASFASSAGEKAISLVCFIQCNKTGLSKLLEM